MRSGEGQSGATGQGDRPELVAYVADAESEAALRAGLADAADGAQIRRGDVFDAAKALAREATPLVLLVDVSGCDDPVTALDRLASVCAPDVKVLVIGDRKDAAFYREITRDLGAAEYLDKPLTRDNVARLFSPHLQEGSEDGQAGQSRGGRIVAVCGARGGVGATTVAVNLAVALEERTRGHVALLDLHLRGGTAAMMVGAKPGAGLRLALEDPERADALFLDRVAIPVGERLRLIAGDEPFDAQPNPSVAAVSRLLDLLRQRFNHIVVDLPMPPSQTGLLLLAQARQRVIVLEPDVAGIRDAEALRRVVAKLPGSPSPPILVVNRVGAPGSLQMRLVEEGLGCRADVLVPDLPRQLPNAVNLGKPAFKECPPLRRALAPLLQEVAGLGSERRLGRSILSRVFGRGVPS